MKIAMFTDTYLPDVNGIANELFLLRRELENRGHEVYIFAPSSRRTKSMNEDPHVIYFSSASFKKYPDFRIALFPFVSAVEKIKHLGIEIIHNHAIGTMALAAVRGMEKLSIPGISSFHYLSYLIEDDNNFTYDLAAKYFRWIYKNFNTVTTPSNFSYKKLSRIGIKPKVIPNGIDFQFFSRRRAKRRTYDFVYSGMLEKPKNLEMIIEHARNIRNVVKKDVTFLMIGEGSHKQYLEEFSYMKAVSDYFLWNGIVSRNKLASIFWKSKTFLFPSSSDTLPLSVLEAMASGVVPVVPEESSLNEIIEDGVNGFIWRDGMDFYRKAVDSLKVDSKFRTEAVKTAKKFDIKEIAVLYEKEYEKVLKK